MKWRWKERFPRQPEVEEYLNQMTDYLDLRKDIQLNSRIKSAHWDEESKTWRVTTAQGESYKSKFLISATGPLATPLKPPFAGLDSFQGEWYQTGLWPKHKVDFTGKRVALVGTGATGVQVVPVVAHSAKSLTVFQRTPNYVMPARNHPLMEGKSLLMLDDLPSPLFACQSVFVTPVSRSHYEWADCFPRTNLYGRPSVEDDQGTCLQ